VQKKYQRNNILLIFFLISDDKQITAAMELSTLKRKNTFEFVSAPEKKTCSCCPFIIKKREKCEITQTIHSGKDNRIHIVLPSALAKPQQKCFQTASLAVYAVQFAVSYSTDVETAGKQELPEEPMCFSLKSNFLSGYTRDKTGEIGTFNEAGHYDFENGCYVSYPIELGLHPMIDKHERHELDRTDNLIVEIVPFTDAYFTPFDIHLNFFVQHQICKMKKQEDGTYQKYAAYTKSDIKTAAFLEPW
jgi:hypothetical protein